MPFPAQTGSLRINCIEIRQRNRASRIFYLYLYVSINLSRYIYKYSIGDIHIHTYTDTVIYYEELICMIIEAESYGLLLANWRPRNPSGVT